MRGEEERLLLCYSKVVLWYSYLSGIKHTSTTSGTFISRLATHSRRCRRRRREVLAVSQRRRNMRRRYELSARGLCDDSHSVTLRSALPQKTLLFMAIENNFTRQRLETLLHSSARAQCKQQLITRVLALISQLWLSSIMRIHWTRIVSTIHTVYKRGRREENKSLDDSSKT